MEISESSSRVVTGLLESRTGQQLTTSRRWRIETALKSLMRERAIASIDDLIPSLIAGRAPALSEAVVEALINNETYFFRDRAPFGLLFKAIGRVERLRAAERRLTVWCAGCSTGQEAYSLAMSFAEEPSRWNGWTIDIVGTDVSRSAIERARAGLYSQFEVQRGLPVGHMMRWFSQEPRQQWRISTTLRKAVRFEVRSLDDGRPHPGLFDVILCRNVLLYFTADMRRSVFESLAAASVPETVLMLGAAETVIGHTDRFIPDPHYRGLYIRADAGKRAAA